MNKKYIIFTDIDGTLYDSNRNCIPNSSLEALKKAKENGHKIFICTGRPYPDINPDYFDLPVEGFILSCGAQIIMNSKTVFANPIPLNLLKPIIQYLVEKNIGFSLDGINRNYLFSDAQKVFRRFECRNLNIPYTTDENADILLAQNHMYSFDLCKENDLKQILKISIYTNNTSDLMNFVDHLPETMHGYIEESTSVKHFAEITLKENSKASGIIKVLEILNKTVDSTIAIGDGYNDIDMLKFAHIGIAMGNACDELKKTADFITKDISNNGFEYALKYFNLIE